MIQNLKIVGLYDIYNYELTFNKPAGVTILTGPNGFGKTTILKIICHIYDNKFWFFVGLKFKEIHLKDDAFELSILKPLQQTDNDIETVSTQDKVCFEYRFQGVFTKFEIDKNYVQSLIGEHLDEDIYETNRRDYTTEDLLEIYYNPKKDLKIQSVKGELSLLLNSKCFLIKDQRIRVFDQSYVSRYGYPRRYRSALNERLGINIIADELKDTIHSYDYDFLRKCQEIDASFMKRLSSVDIKPLDRAQFGEKLEDLKQKIEGYRDSGIQLSQVSVDVDFKEPLKTVYSLYLKDLEEKISIYEDLYNNSSCSF